MLDAKAREVLQKPILARISTLDADGYPHTVPVWFDVDGDDIVVISVRETAKVRHIHASNKGAITIGGDTGDGGGLLLKGQFSIEPDPDDYWMKRLIYRYESGEQAEKDVAEWEPLDIILIRLKVEKVFKF